MQARKDASGLACPEMYKWCPSLSQYHRPSQHREQPLRNVSADLDDLGNRRTRVCSHDTERSARTEQLARGKRSEDEATGGVLERLVQERLFASGVPVSCLAIQKAVNNDGGCSKTTLRNVSGILSQAERMAHQG